MKPSLETGRSVAWALIVCLSLVWARAAGAEENQNDPLMGAEKLDALLWSATILGQLDGIHSDKDNDAVGGFFDQYDFTPNKDGGVAVELGLSEASLDWIDDRAALLQFRFESPTSNLGVSGSDVDNEFLNQHALLLGRTEAFRVDAEYRRFRTEELRLFPETDAGGGALPFTDFTSRNDRFYRERTGFQSEVQWRPDVSRSALAEKRAGYAPEFALRGGSERRESKRQLQTLLNPGNNWLALSDERGDDVSDVGAGVLFVPIPGVTLTLDYDYQEFDADNAILDSSLPFASTSRSIAFVPSTERHTGQVFAHARVSDRAVITAGFQATHLEQKSPETPAQRSADFGENETIAYTAELSGDLRITDAFSASGFVKYAYRDHDLDRSGPLFNPSNGTQVDEFLRKFVRVEAETELRYRASRKARFAAGVQLLFIDRKLDFAQSGLANPVIQPENALVQDQTQMWTLFVRTDLRPLPALGLRGKLSYRLAPETGYITDLDNYFQGELRGTYTLPLARPATVSLFVRGGVGENTNFSLTGGLAPTPPGPVVDRDYQRSHVTLGATGDWAWRNHATFFGSLFYSQDRQDDNLQLSDLQRYFQEAVPITFRSAGKLDYQSEEISLVLGTQVSISERTDGGLSYAYTRAEANFDSGSGRAVGLIDANREVDADIHGVNLELRHRIRDGLRIFAGYRFQYFSDGAPQPSSLGSVRSPPDRSDIRHTVTLGVSLNGDLLARR